VSVCLSAMSCSDSADPSVRSSVLLLLLLLLLPLPCVCVCVCARARVCALCLSAMLCVWVFGYGVHAYEVGALFRFLQGNALSVIPDSMLTSQSNLLELLAPIFFVFLKLSLSLSLCVCVCLFVSVSVCVCVCMSVCVLPASVSPLTAFLYRNLMNNVISDVSAKAFQSLENIEQM
jgi:hypothetical protein